MAHNAGEQPHIVIGDADSLGPVHGLKLTLIKPGDVQHYIGAGRGKGGTWHRAVIADHRHMDDVAIMKDGRRDRHDRCIAEFAKKLHRRAVRTDRQHRDTPVEDRRVPQFHKPPVIQNKAAFRRVIGIMAGALRLALFGEELPMIVDLVHQRGPIRQQGRPSH